MSKEEFGPEFVAEKAAIFEWVEAADVTFEGLDPSDAMVAHGSIVESRRQLVLTAIGVALIDRDNELEGTIGVIDHEIDLKTTEKNKLNDERKMASLALSIIGGGTRWPEGVDSTDTSISLEEVVSQGERLFADAEYAAAKVFKQLGKQKPFTLWMDPGKQVHEGLSIDEWRGESEELLKETFPRRKQSFNRAAQVLADLPAEEVKSWLESGAVEAIVEDNGQQGLRIEKTDLFFDTLYFSSQGANRLGTRSLVAVLLTARIQEAQRSGALQNQ